MLRLLRKHPRYFVHLALRKRAFAARRTFAREHGTDAGPLPPPLVYKLMLNWDCNLRCPMCMLWGDVGWVKESDDAKGQQLDWAVVEKVFGRDLPRDASFIFSGGEPTAHPRYGDLLRLVRERRRFSITCTNGTLLEKHLDVLDGNPYATLLVSLDGAKEVNDPLRGNGVHRRVLANLERLRELRRPPFLGIQFTVMPENVAHVEEFCEAMVELGVDWILLNPGWFLTQEQATGYERLLEDRFGVTPTTHKGYMRSYDYDTREFARQLERVWSRRWPIQIASHIKDSDWVEDFVRSPDKILGDPLCHKQWLRLDVLPDGRVTPCVQFPDLTVGDLREQSVEEVWQGERNREFQRFVSGENLPICAKCNAIYQYGGEA
ncbi:MAG: radical SAM protein [Planctomycetota bacterium]